MSTDRILADHDRAVDVGTAPTTCPVAFYCPECSEPQYVGEPDDLCLDCGGFDWRAEQERGWAS
jgi:hypothetical protein